MNATHHHHWLHSLTHFWQAPAASSTQQVNDKLSLRNVAIVVLWIVVTAILMYLFWIANFYTMQSIEPPWTLPIA